MPHQTPTGAPAGTATYALVHRKNKILVLTAIRSVKTCEGVNNALERSGSSYRWIPVDEVPHDFKVMERS